MSLPFAVKNAKLIHFVAVAFYRCLFDFVRLFDRFYKRGGNGFFAAFEFGDFRVFFVEFRAKFCDSGAKFARFFVMLFVEPRDIIVDLRTVITFSVLIERNFFSLFKPCRR